MKPYIFTLTLCFATAFASTVNYPFPQNSSYNGRGIQANTITNATLISKFNSWQSSFYREQGDLARIESDDIGYSISRDIGKGMLLMVYFSSANRSYEMEFQKLWEYYQKFPDGDGFMHWKTHGFSSVAESSSETEAELDVALALIMASFQFEKNQYLNDAKSLISKIRVHEVDDDFYLQPGNTWNDRKYPSSFAPAAIELFKTVDNSFSDIWSTVLDSNYALVARNQNDVTGLVSNACNVDGSPNGTDYFIEPTTITPWRYAMAYYWFGHSKAKAFLDLFSSWANVKFGTNANAITNGYYRTTGAAVNGTQSSTFLLGIASGLATNSSSQTLLNNAASEAMTFASETSSTTIASLLHSLLLTGNMPNLAAMPLPSSSSSTASSSSSLGNEGLIDDLEDGNHVSIWGGSWFTYSDNAKGGASTVAPLTESSAFAPTASPTNGTNYAGKITFTLDQGNYTFSPYVGLGLFMRQNKADHNLSTCTELKYEYLGSAHRFRVHSSVVTDSNFHGIPMPAATTWTPVALSWVDLIQEDLGAGYTGIKDIDNSTVTALSWQIQNASSTSGSLWIDNVRCIGGKAPVENTTKTFGTPQARVTKNQLSLYPGHKYQVATVYDIFGRVLSTISVHNKAFIPLSAFPAGVYVISLKGNGENAHLRMTVGRQ